MKLLWVEEKIDYDGSQLRRLFAYENYDLLGDSIIAFQGACDVRPSNMKDGEDLFAGEKIYSSEMLHFLIEIHDTKLETMIAYQRLFSAIIMEELSSHSQEKFKRQGDDVFVKDKKLNISIASANSLSAMIHCGINIESKNTPVKTISLNDLKIEPKGFAINLMKRWQYEYLDILEAKKKVYSL